jgi:long-chain acyl-CoA synthetase
MKTAPLDSVKFFVSGADMLPDKIRGAFSMIYGRKIASGYGLTETAPVIAINYNNCEEPTDAVGPVLSGVDCEIRSNSGESLPAGNTGTLWIKGNNVMLGYYKMPEATAHVLHNGWLNTGDFGMIDDKGILFIKGRLKDVIIHKGFNIYPAEIENVLLTHSNIFKVAVVGQAEEMSGQVPVAFLAVKTKNDGLEKELRDLCIRNLATYKIPRKFFYLDDLPMNATGKIDKKQLLI